MLTIRQFGCWFEAGKFSQLKVPDYHRSFEWDSSYISETLSMVERVILGETSSKRIHLREISISPNLHPQYERDDHVLEIVDGAHRILTFVLIFCAVKNQVLETRTGTAPDMTKIMGSNRAITDVMHFLTHNATENNQSHKFIASEWDNDMEVLAAILDGKRIPTDNYSFLPAAYRQIRRWLKRLKKEKSISMEQLAEFLFDRVGFNINFVEDRKDANDIYIERNTCSSID